MTNDEFYMGKALAEAKTAYAIREIPIGAVIDYEKKVIKCTKSFVPNGDIDKEMKSVMAYYKDFKGRHPERFAIEE